MIAPKIIKNQISQLYPQEFKRSYKVKIPINIVKTSDGYQYDLMVFNSLNEYNQWQIEQKDKKINELESKNSNLEDRLSNLETIPDLPTKVEINVDTINSILTEVIPSVIGE